jgi:hypothetical protein
MSAPLSFNRRRLQSEFHTWLSEDVYVSLGTEHAPRNIVLYWFIQDLRAMLGREGYNFRSSDKEMAQDWARYLFRAQRGLVRKDSLSKNPDGEKEDYEMYCHLLDDSKWKMFFDSWIQMDDFSLSRNGTNALFTSPQFAWFHIDINSSGPTQEVDDMLATSDSDGEGNGGSRKKRGPATDPYLADQANLAMKQNRWD